MKDVARTDLEFAALRKLSEEMFLLGTNSLHGPDHWDAVLANGRLLSVQPGVCCHVVQAFSHIHDCCRENEYFDEFHGHRAAELAMRVRASHLSMLDDREFELLVFAVREHNGGTTSNEPTIGACFDADRLELVRVGIAPDPMLMSTPLGKVLAERLNRS